MNKTILNVHIVPGSSCEEISGYHGDTLKIRIKAPASDGKANEALLKFISKTLNIPRNHVRILSGTKSRSKRLLIEGLSTIILQQP